MDEDSATPRGSYYDEPVHLATASAEARSFWARSRNRLVVQLLRRHFPEARSVLEVGCGTGIVLEAVSRSSPDLELIGVDAYAPALGEARRRLPDVRLLQRDAQHLGLDERFDVVLLLDVLEHLDDDVAALRGIHDVLRERGGLLVAVPQHRWLWSAADDWAEHRRRYRRRELLAALDASGFVAEWRSSFVSLLLPLMLIARLRSRDLRRYDPLAEFSLPWPIDRALAAVLRLEAEAIARGISLPLGGSLFVVARKR